MEGVNPLNLLTRDGWQHVISRVQNPEDIITFANTHPLFHSIMTNDRKEDWISAIFHLAFPYFSDYLNKHEVLNLRLVKWIKPIIDKYLQPQKIFSVRPLKLRLNNYLVRSNQNDKDLYMLTVEMRRLSIAKILRYYASYSFSHENYLDCLYFLREFGAKVKYLKLDFNYRGGFPINQIKALKFFLNTLKCVPNITELDLEVDCAAFDYDIPFDVLARGIEQLLKQNSLPSLPNLDTLCIDTRCERVIPCFTAPVIRTILQAYSEQITFLDMQKTPDSVQMIPASPTLKNLRVEIDTLEDVTSLLNLQAPISEIYIRSWDAELSIESKQIFRALEHFRDTLLDVHISTNNWKFGRMSKLPLKVNLPLLRHLKLTGNFNGSIGSNFPFLENFPKLKTFELDLVKPDAYESDTSDDDTPADFMEACLLSDSEMPDENNFYKSTIWETLPDLKSVKLRIEPSKTLYFYPTFTRKAYENFQKNKL